MRRLVLGSICVCVVLACSSLAGATEYFICNQAGTGAGTLANPYKLGDLPNPSVQYDNGTACSILQPGDTLTFLGGTYTLTSQTGGGPGYIHAVRDGTPSAPITFRVKPGDTVTINMVASGQAAFGTMFPPGGKVSYGRFVGFNVNQLAPNAGGEYAGFWMNGTCNEVAYCRSNGYNTTSTNNWMGFRVESSNNVWVTLHPSATDCVGSGGSCPVAR